MKINYVVFVDYILVMSFLFTYYYDKKCVVYCVSLCFMALRVPTRQVSFLDFNFWFGKVNQLFENSALLRLRACSALGK